MLFPDGWIAVAHVGPYRVDWRLPHGEWVRGTPIRGEIPPLTEGERCAALQGWDYRGIAPCDGDYVSHFAWPEHPPPFLGPDHMRRMSARGTPALFAAPDGTLVIRRTPLARSMNSRYDVIDRRGRRIGRIVMGRREAIVGFGDRTVYTIATDDMDLQWLRRHEWPFR